MLNRRLMLATLAVLLMSPHLGSAQNPESDYPSKPVTIIVPFAAGQSGDILARVLAESLSRMWGKSVIVENKGGAGGSIGSLVAARAPADGYTLLMGSPGPTSIAPQLLKGAGYDPRKDFTPIMAVAGVPQMLIVTSDSKYKTMQDMIEDARRSPGKLSYGTGGEGSMAHLTMKILEKRAGVALTHIPYKGASGAYTDLIGGRLDVMFDTTPAALGFVKSGKLRFLAASTIQRTPTLPDIPTISESGLNGFDVLGWLGILAPAGLNPALQQRLNRDLRKVLEDSSIKQRLGSLGLDPIGGSSEDFKKFIESEYEKFGAAIRAGNMGAN